jgi:hypothetical protein
MSVTIQAITKRPASPELAISRAAASTLARAISTDPNYIGCTITEDHQYGDFALDVPAPLALNLAKREKLQGEPGLIAHIEAAISANSYVSVATNDDSHSPPSIRINDERADEPVIQWSTPRAEHLLNCLGIGFSSAKPRSIPAAILKRACLRSTAQLLDSHDVAAVLKVAEYALATGGKCALVNAS